MELTSLARKALKARAHPLHPVVLIGDKGLTDAVLREIEVNLKSHELIKIRVASADREEREAMLQAICNGTRAQPVQHIGKILVIYREKPAEPPPARTREPAQRTPRRAVAPPARERSSRPARRPRPGDKPIVAAYSRDRATPERKPVRQRPSRRPRPDDKPIVAAYSRDRATSEREAAPSRPRSKPDRDREAPPARRTRGAGGTAARPKRPASSGRGTAAGPGRRPTRTR